jgi:hypothetical protein
MGSPLKKKIDKFMNRMDVLVGGMLIAMGIYAMSYIHFHPEKLSPRMSKKTFNWLCIVGIVCGAFTTIARVLFR